MKDNKDNEIILSPSLKVGEFNAAPEFLRSPSNFSQATRLQNFVRKGREDLILTTEYVDSASIGSFGQIIFKKFKNKFRYTTFTIFPSGTGIRGLYIKGIINWSDNTQSSFTISNDISISNDVLTLTVDTFDRTPLSARVRVSQLA